MRVEKAFLLLLRETRSFNMTMGGTNDDSNNTATEKTKKYPDAIVEYFLLKIFQTLMQSSR